MNSAPTCLTRGAWARRSLGWPLRMAPESTTSGSSPVTSTTGWRRARTTVSEGGLRLAPVNPPVANAATGPEDDGDLARRAWRAMSQIALDRDRKIAVSEALGLSWPRVLALRQLATRSYTQRALAKRLSADPPYVTLMVDDLEE